LENAWKTGDAIPRNSKNGVVKFNQHQPTEVPMNQKYILILAAGITAFVLVIGGAIIGRAAGQPETVVTLTPDAAEIQNLYAQREAEYQARLEEANAALTAAYAQQTATANSASQTAAQTVPATISPQDALRVVATLAPRAKLLSLPELVNYQGMAAYEVRLDVGTIYVDANTGTVLYDGTAQTQTTTQTRSFREDEGHEWEDDD
jgi:uncharacterized membrane protein YkoI